MKAILRVLLALAVMATASLADSTLQCYTCQACEAACNAMCSSMSMINRKRFTCSQGKSSLPRGRQLGRQAGLTECRRPQEEEPLARACPLVIHTARVGLRLSRRLQLSYRGGTG